MSRHESAGDDQLAWIWETGRDWFGFLFVITRFAGSRSVTIRKARSSGWKSASWRS